MMELYIRDHCHDLATAAIPMIDLLYPTIIVKLSCKNGKVVQGCDVHIGRRWSMGGWDLPQSIWHNPYPVKKHELDISLEMYEQHIRSGPQLVSQLPSLRGKVLGCWCKPNRCHGDILIKLLREL